ncbi:MAG: hypothetical protein BGN83_17485 [Rhizobium sp. 63-7]|nr:MAG: hypothetical protein BGN83_17485 [Rhizobium sp. 63-7]
MAWIVARHDPAILLALSHDTPFRMEIHMPPKIDRLALPINLILLFKFFAAVQRHAFFSRNSLAPSLRRRNPRYWPSTELQA